MYYVQLQQKLQCDIGNETQFGKSAVIPLLTNNIISSTKIPEYENITEKKELKPINKNLNSLDNIVDKPELPLKSVKFKSINSKLKSAIQEQCALIKLLGNKKLIQNAVIRNEERELAQISKEIKKYEKFTVCDAQNNYDITRDNIISIDISKKNNLFIDHDVSRDIYINPKTCPHHKPLQVQESTQEVSILGSQLALEAIYQYNAKIEF